MSCRKIAPLVIILSSFGGQAIAHAGQLTNLKPQRVRHKSWEGEYLFAETGGRNTGLMIEYSIKVYRKGGVLLADVDADGHQTETRLSGDAKVEGNRLTLYFRAYRPENLFDLYKPGDLLLSLERRHGKLLTYWGAMHPQLTSYKNGRIYFQKRPSLLARKRSPIGLPVREPRGE